MVEGDSPTLAEYFRRENLGPTPPCDATSARMAVLEGAGSPTLAEDFRRGNLGPTPPAYQLVGEEEGQSGSGRTFPKGETQGLRHQRIS